MRPTGQAGFLREAFDILKTTVQEWLDDKASRLAAALSFYTILSLAPLLLLIVAIVGLVVGPDEIQKAVSDQAQSLIGDSGKELVGAVRQRRSLQRDPRHHIRTSDPGLSAPPA